MSLDEAVDVVAHRFIDKLYAKEMMIRRGFCVTTHVHKDAHFSFLGSGRVELEVDGVKREYIGPCLIEIAAGQRHKVSALTDVHWWCVHANMTGETDESKIDEVLIRRTEHAVR